MDELRNLQDMRDIKKGESSDCAERLRLAKNY